MKHAAACNHILFTLIRIHEFFIAIKTRLIDHKIYFSVLGFGFLTKLFFSSLEIQVLPILHENQTNEFLQRVYFFRFKKRQLRQF